MADRLLIAPGGDPSNDWGGLQTNVRPWLVGDKAFAIMQNCNVYRGRIKKRFGSYLIGGDGATDQAAMLNARLRLSIGETLVDGSQAGSLPAGITIAVGAMFSIGSVIYTVNQVGLAVNTLSTLNTSTFTIDTTATPNTYLVTGAPPLTTIFFYPALPVMGLITYQTGVINDEPTYAFDTRFAYQRSAGGWERLTGGSDTWTGTDSDFFWGTTWRGDAAESNKLFVTNFTAADHIRYWDEITAVWTTFRPAFGPGINDLINGCRLIAVYKNRLLLFNTFEGLANTQYFNRLRFSAFGSPLTATAFRDDIPGQGGFEDCPVKQQIVTCEFLKDVLVVYCESSTWQIIYTGNEIQPFKWQQINTELGAESTFSVVPFDKVMIAIGNVGIHACNGTNVERIDQKIPQQVFDIHNENDGIKRVQGIRDYFTELIYWTFPGENQNALTDNIYPNRVLVYNYVTGAWAFHDDSFTALGYFQQQNDITWGSLASTWGSTTMTWNAPQLQGQFRQVIAGNQEGFVFIIDPDLTRNAPSLQITDITNSGDAVTLTVIDHNLNPGDYICIENTGNVLLDGFIFLINGPITNDTLLIFVTGFTGTYAGGGTVARVSRINIWTKQYNFYDKQEKNVAIDKVEFMVDRTDNGAITVDYYASSSDDVSLLIDGGATGALLGSGVLDTSPYAIYPLESNQNRLWHPVYMQLVGSCAQFNIYFSDTQMVDPEIAMNSDFQLHAFIINAKQAGRLQM